MSLQPKSLDHGLFFYLFLRRVVNEGKGNGLRAQDLQNEFLQNSYTVPASLNNGSRLM
jgi:hypothetical protein